ncbi:MAG: hypothetical protein Q4F97_06180 [Bacteroidales bacterium]|nr:hypothetical protein [Bacteroidales bacterium]
MKKVFYLFFSLIFVLASCSTKTTTKQTQPQNQSQNEGVVYGFTPGSATSPQTDLNNVMGPGPVILNQSNFFYAGNMTMVNDEALINLCQMGVTLPLAKDKGIYSEVSSQYQKLNSDMAGFAFRGYFVENKNPQIGSYPYKIVVAYIISMVPKSICEGITPITGTYKAANIPGTDQSAVLTLNPDYSFLLDLNNNVKLKGSFNFKDANELLFFYTAPTSDMGYNGSLNPAKGTLMIPTNSGTVIYTKQ